MAKNLGAYAPTDNTFINGKDKFWESMREIVEEISEKKKELIIMGDLNARVGSKEGNKIIEKHGENIRMIMGRD